METGAGWDLQHYWVESLPETYVPIFGARVSHGQAATGAAFDSAPWG